MSDRPAPAEARVLVRGLDGNGNELSSQEARALVDDGRTYVGYALQFGRTGYLSELEFVPVSGPPRTADVSPSIMIGPGDMYSGICFFDAEGSGTDG